MTGTANIASCTLGNSSSALNVQRLLPLALIDMAKHNSQSSEQSKSSSRFNIFKRPISPTSSEQNQGWSLKLPKLFRKSRSTTPTQSTSSLPLVSTTVDSHGETTLQSSSRSYFFLNLMLIGVCRSAQIFSPACYSRDHLSRSISQREGIQRRSGIYIP
jgi:hypothetical protein